MKPTGVLLYECTSEEIERLPQGFPVIEYDELYESIRIVQAGIDRVRHGKRFVHYLYRLSPAGIVTEEKKA